MKKILLVVDMQKGFITTDNYKALNEKVNNLLNLNNYDKYIFTKFINTENSLYQTKLNWFGLIDKNEQELSISLPNDNYLVFEKTGYGLSNAQLKEIIDLNIDSIDICGLQSDACVYAIAFQLFDNGIFPNILINYCETTPNRNDMAKEMLIHQFGAVDERV